MNNLVVPFINIGDHAKMVKISNDGHFYEAFIDSDYATTNNIESIGEDERTFETTISVRVLGYLVGEDTNQAQPFNVVRENPVEIRITREKSSIGERPDHNDVTKKYRELGENPEGIK